MITPSITASKLNPGRALTQKTPEVTMADDDANTPNPETSNNDLMIKTIQNLQESIKTDFGNLSEKILTMDKTLNDVKTTVNQANDKATDTLRITNEAQLAAINVDK